MQKYMNKPKPSSPTPPGPKGSFLLGSLKEVSKNPLEFTTNLALKHPGIAHFKFIRKNIYVISSPEYVRQIFQVNNANFRKSRHYRFLKLMLGEGLLSSEGDFWKRQRKLANPAFHKTSLEGFINTFKQYSEELANEWERKYANSDKPVDVLTEMSALALRIVGKTLLNVDLSEQAKEFKDAVKYGLGFVNKKQNSFNLLPLWFPKSSNKLFLYYRNYMNDIIYKVIDERLQQRTKHNDLLDMYLNSVDEETGERMSREQLRDEVMTIFVAGFETNAIALTWSWYLLHQHPDKSAKLQDFLDTDNASSKTMEDWFRQDYVSMVIKESMRLYPPIYNIGRTNIEDEQIDKYTIKRGSVFLINTVALHRNREVWKDPDDFIPERFLTDEVKAIEKSAYSPFGAGQRMCIGHQFAMLEMKVILHTLASRFKLTLKEGHPVERVPAVTLNPKYGMLMHIRKR